jgi:hypothetical protein
VGRPNALTATRYGFLSVNWSLEGGCSPSRSHETNVTSNLPEIDVFVVAPAPRADIAHSGAATTLPAGAT